MAAVLGHRRSAVLGQLLTTRLPNSRTRAVWPLGLFAAVQVADAVMTFSGVQRFGFTAEANPLLSFYMTTWGVGVTLVGAKSIAIILAILLSLRSQHLIIAVLTLIYVVGAICPWAWLSTAM